MAEAKKLESCDAVLKLRVALGAGDTDCVATAAGVLALTPTASADVCCVEDDSAIMSSGAGSGAT